MFLRASRIIGLKVIANNGNVLGEVKDFEVNAATQSITAYLVISNRLVRRLTSPEIIIKPSQVISVDDKKMVVEDLLLTELAVLPKPQTAV